jgi:hypothetical protein
MDFIFLSSGPTPDHEGYAFLPFHNCEAYGAMIAVTFERCALLRTWDPHALVKTSGSSRREESLRWIDP